MSLGRQETLHLSPNLSDIPHVSPGIIPKDTYPAPELFALLHFPRVAVDQEAGGVAEAGRHGLPQQLQKDALQRREGVRIELLPEQRLHGLRAPRPAQSSRRAGQIGLTVDRNMLFLINSKPHSLPDTHFNVFEIGRYLTISAGHNLIVSVFFPTGIFLLVIFYWGVLK